MPTASEVAIARTTALLASLVPGKGSLVLREALAVDEAVWFLKAKYIDVQTTTKDSR